MYFVTLLNYTLAGNTGRRFARSVANSSVGRKVVVFFSVNNLSQQQRAVNIDLILDFFCSMGLSFSFCVSAKWNWGKEKLNTACESLSKQLSWSVKAYIPVGSFLVFLTTTQISVSPFFLLLN